MDSENVLYYGDEGKKIVLDVGIDISDATDQQIKFKKPNGDRGYWPAQKESDRSISYVVQKGDANYVGRWRIQSYVETPNWKLHGTPTDLHVLGGM